MIRQQPPACGNARPICAGLIAALAVFPPVLSAQEEAFSWRAYSQLTGAQRENAGDMDFEIERTRLVLEHRTQRFRVHTQFELAADDLSARSPGLMPEGIFALFADHDLSERHTLRLGQFKTPLGMDFLRPASNLEIISRGMEAGLVLHRDTGLMLSGRQLGRGFGYDVVALNPAGRSAATRYQHGQVGEDHAYIARGLYDSEHWHVELSTGFTTNAGGPATADYEVTDLGARYFGPAYNFELEWIDGHDVRGVDGRDERVYFLHGARAVLPRIEFVARYYSGASSLSGTTTRLSNTHLGATIQAFATDRLSGRIQVNYVLVGGNEAAYSGVRAFRSDTLLLQFQLHAEK